MEINTKMFDGYADKYDQWFLTNNKVFESELKLLHACLNPLKKDKILSVGCGSGLFESALKSEYGINVEHGLEPSTDMAEIAEKRGVKVEIGDAETTQLKDEEYDIISAKNQTHAKARRGNVWFSSEGMALFTFYINPKENFDVNEYLKLPLVAGVAVINGLKKIEIKEGAK